MFGNSFIVGMVLKFLAEKGVAYLEDLSKAHKAEAEAWIKELVKPDSLDEPVWKAVETVWDVILAAAKVLAGRLVSGVNKDQALAQAVAEVKPHFVRALGA